MSEEFTFKRVYTRGLHFCEFGMSSDTFKFNMIIEMTENYLTAKIKTGKLPGEKELKICFMNFDHLLVTQNDLMEEMEKQNKQIQQDRVFINKRDEKER